MDKELKISVIVPVYNGQRYLRQCLDSLLEQGIAEDQYEIVCVNDGSRDDSGIILKEYADAHRNIVVVDQNNAGVSAARNSGLDRARGKYIWFVDADDWIARDFLARSGIMQLLDGDCTCVPLVMTKCVDVYEQDVPRYCGCAAAEGVYEFEELSPFMTTTRGHFFAGDMIEKYGLRYDTNLSYGEDLMFMREFLDHIRFEKEAGRPHRILQCSMNGAYLYRIHDDSAMGLLRSRAERVAENILYRARWSMARHRMEDKPDWYRANYQEYVNLHMQEYMLYYFPMLDKPILAHLRELRREGLYPAPPPKLGWVKETSTARRIQQFVFRCSAVYPLYCMVMRFRMNRRG